MNNRLRKIIPSFLLMIALTSQVNAQTSTSNIPVSKITCSQSKSIGSCRPILPGWKMLSDYSVNVKRGSTYNFVTCRYPYPQVEMMGCAYQRKNPTHPSMGYIVIINQDVKPNLSAQNSHWMKQGYDWYCQGSAKNCPYVVK